MKKLINQAKELYIKGKLDEEHSDPKRFWRSLSELTGFGRSKTKCGLSNIISDDGQRLDGTDAANYMNHFYTTAGPKLASKFNDDWDANQSKISTDSVFSFSKVSENDIRKLCKEIKLSKSSAMGLLSTCILKDAFEACIPEIAYVFNCCLETGSFPLSWGVGEITPIPKISVSNKKPENWRPITQIKLPGKLLERCLHTQIFSYLDTNNLLSTQQHGFVPKKSTSTAVFEMLKTVYQNWNARLPTVCTFIDFSRAFDSIDHKILLNKLRLYGFDVNSVNFMSSYLDSRRQYTVVNGCRSNIDKVTYGIAQGSIVGPLIYILYANDVFQEVDDQNAMLMYADDTLLLSSGSDVDESIRNGQCMLDKVIAWCDSNKLTINVKKTKSMFINPKKEVCNSNLQIHTENIDFVNSFEYLGIHIDHSLSMNNHVDSIYKKCTMKLSLLYKIRHFISQNTALSIFKSMIRPYMDYGDFIIDSAHSVRIDRLERLQNRIKRLIEYCHVKENWENINVLMNTYNVEPLHIRRKRNILNIMYDQSLNADNISAGTCEINLRSSKKVKMKSAFTKLTKVMKSPLYRGLELWNQLPHELQNEPSKVRLKNVIKKHAFVDHCT